MSMQSKPRSSPNLEIPADLSAADARVLIDTIRAQLNSRRKNLPIELSDAPKGPSISAMQILLSLQATSSKVAITLGARASAAIGNFVKPQVMGAAHE